MSDVIGFSAAAETTKYNVTQTHRARRHTPGDKNSSHHSSHLTSSDLISTDLISSKLSALIGHCHDKLDRAL